MKETKTFDGIMSPDDGNDVIGKTHHKYAKNGIFKGDGAEFKFSSIRGNQKINNTLPSLDCKLNGIAKLQYACTLDGHAEAYYCDLAGIAEEKKCQLSGTAVQVVCEPLTGQAFQMFYYYDLVRCDGSPGTLVGRSKRQSIPLGAVYAGGTFATYACRYINSGASGPYYDYNFPGMPVQAPPYDVDLTNPSYVYLDPGNCKNCLYCDPSVNGWGMGYHATSASMACYNRIAPPQPGETGPQLAARKPTIYTQCEQKTLGNGVVVYASAPLNNPTGLLPAGYYAWSDPSDYTNTNAKVWYVSAADTIVSILHNEQTCESVGYPALVGTYSYGCATACYTDNANPQYNQYYNGTGYVTVTAITGGTARDYRWTITNPAGTTSSMLTLSQQVNGVTYNLGNGIYKIRVYDSRQTVYTEYSVTIGCQCCLDITGQAFQVYYYYTLQHCTNGSTYIGRSIRQSISTGLVWYLGGAFNCASITGTTSNTNYTLNLDQLGTPPGQPVANGCNNTTYCKGTPNAYSTAYGSSQSLACYYYGVQGPTNKITLYTQNNITTLATGVFTFTSYDAFYNPTSYPTAGQYYSNGTKVWYMNANGQLGTEYNCADFPFPTISASVSKGCNGYEGNGYITVSSASGGTGSGYYWTLNNGGSRSMGSSATGLGNATYSVKVYDSRGSDYREYSTDVYCAPEPGAPYATVVSGCVTYEGTGYIDIYNVGGGTGSGYYWTLNGSGYYTQSRIGSLGNGSYTIRVYDSRGTLNTAYTVSISCAPTPPAPTLNYDYGCLNAPNTGYININNFSGGTGTGYYATIDNSGYFTAGTTVSNLGNGTHIIRVYDSRASETYMTSYSVYFDCQTPATNYTYQVSYCNGGSTYYVTSSPLNVGSYYQTSDFGVCVYIVSFDSMTATSPNAPGLSEIGGCGSCNGD